MSKKTAVIIGAGPAGLTAAYELLKTTDIRPILIECSDAVGGISKTINYKGNLIDLGGHRFFSKSDMVLKWWSDILPIEVKTDQQLNIVYHNQKKEVSDITVSTSTTDKAMIIVNRRSRIYYNKKFFPYPLTFSFKILSQLGIINSFKIAISYIPTFLPIKKKEENLEDFLINRFGKRLYLTFFKTYTEKVWGVPCNSISSEWGRQRIKGLSLSKTFVHFINKSLFRRNKMNKDKVETSLIESFLYPKKGPGQLWETVEEKIIKLGGEIYKNHTVTNLFVDDNIITSIKIENNQTKEQQTISGEYFLSTMAIKDLINEISDSPPEIRTISNGLVYRDFIIVGILLKKVKLQEVNDNWIYIHDPKVKVGRLQFFNNWSPYMTEDNDTSWIGAEFFCNTTDEFWELPDTEIINIALSELEEIGIIDKNDYLDATVIKVPKAYPAYFGSYSQFTQIRTYLDSINNLYLIGRNGMHRYNNQDHSMLTAIKAVELIKEGIVDKSAIWNINTEDDYHEVK